MNRQTGINLFDAVVYINLSHRKDREQELLQELNQLQVLPEKIHRIEGVWDPKNGHRGCVQSHIKALKFAQEKGWEHVLILEDDFMVNRPKAWIDEMIDYFFQKVHPHWDVFFLGCQLVSFEVTPIVGVHRVMNASAAHSYVVHRPYLSTLLAHFQNTYEKIKNHPLAILSAKQTFDILWKELQEKDRWYIVENIGQQRPSFSDIEDKIRKRKFKEIHSFFQSSTSNSTVLPSNETMSFVRKIMK